MASRLQVGKSQVKEMEIVLHNYKIILSQAANLDPDCGDDYHKQLLFTIFTEFLPRIQETLDSLRWVLNKHFFTEVDANIHALNAQYNKHNDVGQWLQKDFLSPLVLLLRLANNRAISFSEEHRDWGRLGSFHRYLASLQLKEGMAAEQRYWPGIPSCIFSVVPIWTSHQIVISASNDRFPQTNTIQKYSTICRNEYLETLKSSCTTAMRKKIDSFASSSIKFQKRYEAFALNSPDTIDEDSIATLVDESQLTRIHLPGIMVSLSPSGAYKPSCLLDYCRFHMLHPPKAEEFEQAGWWKGKPKGDAPKNTRGRRITGKKVWGSESCAEWAAFMELASVPTATVTDATQW